MSDQTGGFGFAAVTGPVSGENATAAHVNTTAVGTHVVISGQQRLAGVLMGRRPLIAVSAPVEELPTPFGAQDCIRLVMAYTDAVYAAGGQPAVVPLVSPAEVDVLAGFDGLILTGGGDVDPELYGEAPDPSVYGVRRDRDAFETALYREAVERSMPILAICRGMQLVNVLRGGSLIQNIEDEVDHWQTAPSREATHKIDVQPGTRLAAVFDQTIVGVNSYHHQALRVPGAGLRVTAVCGAVIEAVEAEDADLVAVQWHPEQMAATDSQQLALFASFIGAATGFAISKTKEK